MIVDTVLARELWADETLRNEDLAIRLGITKHQIHSLRRWLGLPPRYYKQPVKETLTVREIRRRAAAIRRSWSPEEREKRRVGSRRGHWVPPSYDYDHKHSVFHPA